ncbi:MAG TPA: hypothetical protein VIM52_06565 [Stellaceae bacterium]
MAQTHEPHDLGTQMRESSLEHLSGLIANSAVGSQVAEAAKAELTRREILTTQEAATAQVKNARWMFWSVIVVALTSLVNLALQFRACK